MDGDVRGDDQVPVVRGDRFELVVGSVEIRNDLDHGNRTGFLLHGERHCNYWKMLYFCTRRVTLFRVRRVPPSW